MKTFAVLWFAGVTLTAAANDPPAHEPRDVRAEATFAALDRNDDERVSKAEAEVEGALFAQFESVDKDSDGYLSKSEFVVHVTQNTTLDR